jgi:hypothetical protein
MSWLKRKQKLPRLGSRKHPHLPQVFIPGKVESYPGFEATDNAFFHAMNLVSEAVNNLEKPEWAEIGKKNFLTYLNIQGLKLPDAEFHFFSKNLPTLWNTFRSHLMQPEVYGKWSIKEYGDVNKLLTSEYQRISREYGRADKAWPGAADLTMVSLDLALERQEQILAQPIIEYVFIIWLSYCRGLENQ